MITLQDALDRLGIDYADGKVEKNVARKLATAEATLRGAIGDDVRDYLPNDERVDELVGAYLEELYDNRGVGAKVAAATRHMINSLELQLKAELRRAKDAAGAGGA